MVGFVERLFRRCIAVVAVGAPSAELDDRAAWLAGAMRQARLRFDRERERAEAVGVTHYRWRSAGDGDVCRVCRSRDGKRFSLRGDPRFQHPGFMLCDGPCGTGDGADAGPHPCRCRAEMIPSD